MIEGSDFYLTTLTTAPFALHGQETASDRLIFTNVETCFMVNNLVGFLHEGFQ